MADETIAALIPIEDGADAEAKPLRQNFKYLDDRITAQATNISNKETISQKNTANGYCGLDSNGNIPSTQKNDIIRATVGAIYPVGSIYVTTSTSETCPLASLITGSTWVKVGGGRVLQGADSNHAPNTTIAAGLPNITGTFPAIEDSDNLYSGAFYLAQSNVAANVDSTHGDSDDKAGFNASRSSSIYGNSSTVQPPAYVVNIWRRTA